MKILILDNYDSFTYNLVHCIKQESVEYDVIRNDKITAQECSSYEGIVLSPGPGIPSEAGNMMDIITHCAGQIPILGICLGHQAIGEYLGGKLTNMEHVYHGVESKILLSDKSSPLLSKLPPFFNAGRYHSWIIESASLPNGACDITATDTEGNIMGIQHTEKKLYGVQFHPESIMTPQGSTIIQNFINLVIQS